MSVLDGYNKYKRYIKTNDGYKLCSQWTSSNTVQMDDGNTLQTNLGAINGITDSLTATSSNIAASAAAVKTLNDNLDSKQSTITGGASTIVSSNLTASRALISNSSGKIAASSITTTKLGYLANVTSDIQTQLNAKISTSASCNKNWAWSGQAGQPSWLWGSNDGSNCYVWNPANFSVNHAQSSKQMVSRNGGHYLSFEWTAGSTLALYVDNTYVADIQGFIKYRVNGTVSQHAGTSVLGFGL